MHISVHLYFFWRLSNQVNKKKYYVITDCCPEATEEQLYAKYRLTKEETDFIESMIKQMELKS